LQPGLQWRDNARLPAGMAELLDAPDSQSPRLFGAIAARLIFREQPERKVKLAPASGRSQNPVGQAQGDVPEWRNW
jgi:hypothetical protein